MRFEVPQFIEIEDKIFGPLTFKQFIYLVGGAGIAVIFYVLLPSILAIALIIPVVGLSLALAFYEVNKRPFIHTLEHAIKYALKPRLYVWQQRERKVEKEKIEEAVPTTGSVPRVSNSKLKDMAWSLGVRESLYADTEQGHRSGGVDPSDQSNLVDAGANMPTAKGAEEALDPKDVEVQNENSADVDNSNADTVSDTPKKEKGVNGGNNVSDIKSRLNLKN